MEPVGLIYIWNRLRSITNLRFKAESNLENGWNAEGEGRVVVSEPAQNILIFREYGSWKSPEARTFTFKNTYRWKRTTSSLQLEHLRRGFQNSVFLIELHASTDRKWESRTPHVCGDDLYSGVLRVLQQEINLKWTVRGPRKNDILSTTYR